jgi:hypothetical protein
LASDVIQNRSPDALDRIQQRPGHLDEANPQRHGKPVHRAAPAPDLGQIGLFQREKVFDLER